MHEGKFPAVIFLKLFTVINFINFIDTLKLFSWQIFFLACFIAP